MTPPNPLRPLTRDEITEEDIKLLNAIRLGLIPFMKWTKEQNGQVSYAAATDVMEYLHWHEMSIEEKRFTVEKLFQLQFAIKEVFNREKLGDEIEDKEKKSKKIKGEIDKRNRKKVEEAIANRDSNGTLKGKKVGAKTLNAFEKVIKSLIAVKSFPDDAIISTVSAIHPEVAKERILEAIKKFR